MSSCPFCGQRISERSNRCEKCGAIISPESKDQGSQCTKCGGLLKGNETKCSWCGFPTVGKSVEVSDAYELLKSFENALREFIQARLSRVDRNWWEARVPEEIRKVANSRKSKDDRLYPWHIQKDLSPIHYVDFSDYAKIIALDMNWNQVFRGFFKNRLFISTKLRELEPIRTAIAHARDIDPKDLQKLKLYSEEILACLSTMPGQLAAPLPRKVMIKSSIAADVSAEHAVLSIRRSDENPDILQIEFLRGGIGDVVRPKPIREETTLREEDRRIVEEGLRELLQATARTIKSQERHRVELVIEEITGEKIPILSDLVQGVGQVVYSFLPLAIKDSLKTMPQGSLLMLALDERVVGLPWELSFDGNGYLCTRFGVGRVVYSGDTPLKRRKNRPETRVLLVGNPDNTLPDITERVVAMLKEELRKLGAVVDHMYYAPREPAHHASKGNMVKALTSGLYDVVHFDGHAFYDPDYPQQSGFKMADGVLSALEISRVLEDLASSGKEAPFLFYANSCEAGAQRSWDIKEYESQVLGLSHAFIRHNVAYIGAFWSAAVGPSDWLAHVFYKRLLDTKEPLGLCLRNARLAVLNNPKLGPDCPNCEWANFILYGDPCLTIKI